MLDAALEKRILSVQKNEITEYFIYRGLAQSTKDPHNKSILERIAKDELGHSAIWGKYTNKAVKPDRVKVWLYQLISKVLGLTFGIKLMEGGEEQAQRTYGEIARSIPEAAAIASEESVHERQLIGLIDEERLRYTGDIVRGLNIALVEITGTVAGLTLALEDAGLVVLAALIAGFAMSLSVASTEYLATRAAGGSKHPLKAVLYAGLTNILTVIFLIFPYLIFANIYIALGFMVFNALIVILLFSFYISVAKTISFKERFVEMSLLSIGIAALAFGIGLLAREFLHLEI